MSCPICQGVCRCGQATAAESATPAKDTSPLNDGEPYDPSEERFAASLESRGSDTPVTATPEDKTVPISENFEPEKSSGPVEDVTTGGMPGPVPFETSAQAERLAQLRPARRAIVLGEPKRSDNILTPDEWKQEVSSRVTRFRSRRPRTERPRTLDFDFDPETSFPPAPPLIIKKPGEAASVVPLTPEERSPESQQQAMDLSSPSLGESHDRSGSVSETPSITMEVDAADIQRGWPSLPPPNPNPFWNPASDVADVPIQQNEPEVETSQQPQSPHVPATADTVAHDFVESLEIPATQLNAEIISKLAEAIRAAEKRNGGTVNAPVLERVAMPVEELAEPPASSPHIFEEEEVRQAERLLEHVAPTVQIAPPIATVDLRPRHAEAKSLPDAGLFLPIAPLYLRVAMEAVDFSVSVVACLLFTAILMWFGALPAGKPLAIMMAILSVFFWSLYQYLLLVNSGSTLGMRATGLLLASFETKEVSRSRRRARALAMTVSALALGVGFAWALLDLDRLSWHDRASGTFLTRKSDSV